MKMNPNQSTVEKMREIFTRYLIEKKLRKTTERYTILEHICHVQGHFDVEMLHDRLEEDNFHVSRASIYNTIELLLEARLIVRHQFSLQLVQYELISVSAKHHHTICNYCGAVKEIKNDRMIDGMENCRIPKFTYEHHLLYIYGMCSKCKFKLANKNKKDNL